MRLTLAALLCAMLSVASAQETRYHQLSRRAKGSDGAVKIVASTFIGGAGADELVAVCYQPDGALLAVGNAWGPEPDAARVWGPDAYRPAPVWGAAAGAASRKLDRANPNLAGCLWRVSPDLTRVAAVARLGWGTGVVTSALVGADGALYLGGLGREPFVNWARGLAGAKVQPPDAAASGGQALFVMRCRADLSGVDWVALFERGERQAGEAERRVGGRVGARFRILAEKELVAQAYGRLYSLDAVSGAARELGAARGGVLLAADPRLGRIYTGGDENTDTGREPWRRPFLTAYDRAGQVLWQYWRWDSRVVGSDEYRLVSDSSVRGLAPLEGEKVLVWGWSDGGNSVFLRQPTSLDQIAPLKQGFVDSLWGAGVGSFGWLMGVDAARAETYSATNVAAFLTGQNKPNSSRIDGGLSLSGGRVAVVGSSAHAFVETPDAWVRTYPAGSGGQYLAIYNEPLSELLFGSLLPGVEGPLAMARRGSRLVVVGTSPASASPDGPQPPLVAAAQADRRGEADGYLLVAETGP